MPYPNEHAARLEDPAKYADIRRENNKFGKGIHAIWGILESGTVELQAIRFTASMWTVAEAKAWLKAHDYHPILFEEATGTNKVRVIVPYGMKVIKLRSKSFGLKSDEHKGRYWMAFDRERWRWVEVVKKQFAEHFDNERRAVKRELDVARKDDELMKLVDKSIKKQTKNLEELIAATYLAVGQPFAERVLEDFKSVAGFELKQYDDWERLVLDYLRDTSGTKISQINETTRELIKESIAEGVDAGESIPQIAKRIDQLYLDKIIPNRSTTIARTEVIAASNAGSMFAAESTGLDLKKEWLATRDSRTRDTHLDYNGESVPLDEPFELSSGARLMFPGDTSLGAPAAEIVNCRCTQIYSRI